MATADDDKDLAESLGDLLWSDSEYGLSEFLDIFPLPQLVQVSEGVYGESDESTLPAGQTLTLHVVKETKMFRGYTYGGDDVLVPLNCPQKVEVRPQNVSLEYDTVEQLYSVFLAGRVKYVRVTKDHTSHFPERCLRAGQKLKIEYLKKDKTGKEPTLICLDEQGCEVCLAMDVKGGFQPLADNREYFLAELADHFPLPVYVQFTSPPKFSAGDSSKMKNCERFLAGLIQMDEIVVENTVIASTKAGGRKTILTFPRSLDVDLIVPEQLLSQDSTYARICKTLNDGVDLLKAESLTVPDDEVIYGNRAELVREFSCSGLLGFSVGPSHRYVNEHYDDTLPTSVQLEKTDSTDDDEAYIEIDKELHNYQYIDEEDMVYEQVDGPLASPKPTIPSVPSEAATSSGNSASSDNYTPKTSVSSMKSFFRIGKMSGKAEDKQSADAAAASLAQNIQPRFTASAYDMDEDEYCLPVVDPECRKESECDIQNMSVNGVSNLLQSLNLGQYTEKFKREQVDGKMLHDLNKTMLKNDFHMEPFHAHKLEKAVLNKWRPKV